MASTHDQAQQTKAQILDTAKQAIAKAPSMAWLQQVLTGMGQSPTNGILVHLHEVPDQAGHFYRGTWLNTSLEFWVFEVTVSSDKQMLLEVERMENVTSQVPVTARGKGAGKSFGRLALDVLLELSQLR